MRTYTELIRIPTFQERFKYLEEACPIGGIGYGPTRWMNQRFYKSDLWKRVRRQVILRDNGCDLAHPDYGFNGTPIVHHINPICLEQILDNDPDIYNPEYLITTSRHTHNALHHSDERILAVPTERKPNDMCPWR